MQAVWLLTGPSLQLENSVQSSFPPRRKPTAHRQISHGDIFLITGEKNLIIQNVVVQMSKWMQYSLTFTKFAFVYLHDNAGPTNGFGIL